MGHYEVLELLGSGAFGSVYKVCKKDYVVLSLWERAKRYSRKGSLPVAVKFVSNRIKDESPVSL